MTHISSSSGRSSSGRSSSSSLSHSNKTYSSISPSYNSLSRTISTIKSKPSFIPPPTSAPAPAPAPSNKTELDNKSNGGGFMSSIKDGFGFGFGSSIAQRVIGGIFGSSSSSSSSYPTYTQSNSSYQPNISQSEYFSKPECKSFQEEYLKCIQSFDTDHQTSCDFSLNMFKDCETNY